MGKSWGIVFTVVLAAGIAGAGQAEEATTLERIGATSTIRVGQRESSVPFSYRDGSRRVVGYSQDILPRIVAAIRGELKLPALTIAPALITSQNWIPLLINGTVDIECSSTSHTAEREKKVAFSNTIFVIGTRILSRRGAGIADFPDLAGQRVVVTAGTTAERALHRFNEERSAGMAIVAAKDHDEAFRELASGRVAAFVNDDALLYGERAKAGDPGDWVVTGTPLEMEAYACTMRKDDDRFKAVVDTAIADLMTSGEARSLYEKWFNAPIPPDGMNLAWPMPEALDALFRAPNDRPVQ